jgi:hypothetical protein
MVSNRIPSPLYIVNVYSTIILIHTGKRGRGGELNQRYGERGNKGKYRSQTWVENTNMT